MALLCCVVWEKRTFTVFDQHVPLTKESLLARAEVERLDFLTCQQMSGIASEELTGNGSEREQDIVAYAGVYIFTDLANERVVKIGETETLRQRIAKAHLRHWNQSARADLCGFYHARGLPWPESIDRGRRNYTLRHFNGEEFTEVAAAVGVLAAGETASSD